MPDTELERITKVCKALSDATRLKILLLLTGNSLCVNAIVGVLGISQPAVSQHLRILRETDLVRADRRGCWVHYVANLEKLREFADILSGIIKGKEGKVARRRKQPCSYRGKN